MASDGYALTGAGLTPSPTPPAEPETGKIGVVPLSVLNGAGLGVRPEMLFWSNINIACYALPPAELRTLIAERVAQGAPDGAKLAFEVSEQIPANWHDSLRVVLETLHDIA